jgi:hypothetical protein
MSALGNLLADIRNRAIRISKLPVKNKWAKIQYQPAKLVKRTNWVVAKLTSPLLAWRLMALRDLSFYFLISNLVAVMLRFLEGRVKTKRVTGKKCPIILVFVYISLPPGTGAKSQSFAERKLGRLSYIPYGASKKRALF